MVLPLETLPTDEIAALCRKHKIRELALFGSAVRDDFASGSDVDLLVDFNARAEVGFMKLAAIQRELSELLDRQVDLVPKSGLKPAIRESVLAGARIVYAAE